jgi:hypothetical protein
MTVARQVNAKGLQAKFQASETFRRGQSTPSLLVGGSSANDDVISYLPCAQQSASNSTTHDSTSIRIAGNGIAVTAGLLGLTEHQRELLEQRATSLTASEHRSPEGADALVVFDSEVVAGVSLHELGFSRIRERSSVLPLRFYKVLNPLNGAPVIAWARLERSVKDEAVYAHISVTTSA